MFHIFKIAILALMTLKSASLFRFQIITGYILWIEIDMYYSKFLFWSTMNLWAINKPNTTNNFCPLLISRGHLGQKRRAINKFQYAFKNRFPHNLTRHSQKYLVNFLMTPNLKQSKGIIHEISLLLFGTVKLDLVKR